ncbi:hypothetical protein KORDIASMS9_02508 [Kordia sp. SMS9]|uniref:hypothetical protein n=1 Tax=Kordia sp. SMS9 TaxID=2282170 RepID=UPI000E10572A|nr:hypothetical protein [Kordia sp. SMS9]AXG70269.1 hypothetical protein KORDIASMS9_02508 [Kordia sp. SMS9]
MKKRSISTLQLNKRTISELQALGGRAAETTTCPTESGCSCDTCRTDCRGPKKPVN